MPAPDLDAYTARIGFTGPLLPVPETLAALCALHPAAIPFENLDALAGVAPQLELRALEHKLLHARRGGWCFEHNLLLRAVLLEAGFPVTALAARVLWDMPADAVTARSHMLLRVEAGGEPWLADVGFGGLTPTAPLRFVPDLVQQTPHGPFVLRLRDDGWHLLAVLAQGERALYRFDLTPQLPLDYEHANWFLATHSASRFTTSLRAARPARDGRHTLADAEYSWWPLHGERLQRRLDSVAALRALLATVFGLDVPDSAVIDARLAAVLHNAAR